MMNKLSKEFKKIVWWKEIGWGVFMIMFGLGAFVVGQKTQAYTIQQSVSGHFTSEWEALSKDNEQAALDYQSICIKGMLKQQLPFSPFKRVFYMRSSEFKECAQRVGASGYYSALEKSDNLITRNWPLDVLYEFYIENLTINGK